MNASKILLTGLTGTSMMTLFSYIASKAKGENFKEPELLAALEKDALPEAAKELALPAGWCTHYSIGIGWSLVYQYLWEKTKIKPTVETGLILGGLSGLTGILFWRLFFKMHPNPPHIHYKKFYGHLLLAHLIYSTSVTIASRQSK